MNNQQPTPYLLPLQAYGLQGFNSGLVSLGGSPAHLAAANGQLGKLATGLPLAGGSAAYQGGNLAVTMGTGALAQQLPGQMSWNFKYQEPK